jgi:hypothetical protein
MPKAHCVLPQIINMPLRPRDEDQSIEAFLRINDVGRLMLVVSPNGKLQCRMTTLGYVILHTRARSNLSIQIGDSFLMEPNGFKT